MVRKRDSTRISSLCLSLIDTDLNNRDSLILEGIIKKSGARLKCRPSCCFGDAWYFRGCLSWALQGIIRTIEECRSGVDVGVMFIGQCQLGQYIRHGAMDAEESHN